MTYEDFADEWYTKNLGEIVGTCREAVEAMAERFPSLTKVRGTVVMLNSPDGDTRPWPHWWCVDVDGDIQDPTASQFPSALVYTPWDESKEEPTGKCPNCGEYCFEGRYLCSTECEVSYAAYVNTFKW